jgi:dihydrolipoamide dehydrogenase
MHTSSKHGRSSVADAFDLVVLGAGTGGYSAAIRAATLGLKVALVERDKVGGTCLHRGCIPTKALLHSAEVFDTIREGAAVGVSAGEPTFDWAGVQSYKEKVVGKMYGGLQSLIKHRKIEVVTGTGRFHSANTIAVDGREVTGKNVVIATGSAPKLIPGIEQGERVITSDEAMTMGVPRSAIVLGGGSVGCEFASVWASFGAQVTIVEMLPSLVPLEDPDLGKELAKQFGKRGIKVLTGAKLEDTKVADDGVTATISIDGKTETVEAEVLLVAVGRKPVTEGADLAKAGVQLDQRGFVTVNDRYETSARGVFAVGDVIPTPGLAHVSFGEGMCVAEDLAGGKGVPVNYDAVPRVTYCAPEVAAVGLTESQARERGFDVVTKTINLTGIGKAVILGGSGFCKIVAEKGGKVLGAHFVGPRVTELVAEAMLAVGWEAMPEEIAAFIHPHPSLTESFGEAALALSGRALHAV